jgi:hypothetical protein
VARYGGDANNAPAGPTACADPAEAVVLAQASPAVTTRASGPVVAGGAISDSATLTGGANPTGTITFDLFGPDDPTCAGGAAFASTVAVTGNATYGSGPFPATAPGTYRWLARYSGDADNRAAGPTACDDPAEQAVVRPLPSISVAKTAVPASLTEPGGSFLFEVAVTNTGSSTVRITGLADDVYGDVTTRLTSTCGTAPGTVLAPGGTYPCRFTGDFTGRAGDRQTDRVTATAVDDAGNVASAAATATVTLTVAPPSISVTKAAAPATRGEPGGAFTFTVAVANTGRHPVTVTSITDDVYGNLNGRGTCAIAGTVAANGAYTCAFTGNFFGNAGARQTDTVAVAAVDDQGQTASASGRATVVITDVPPTITVDLEASPATRPEPGGTFTFDALVTNTSFETVTVTSLADSVGGDLNGRGTCLTGATLAPNGGTYRCSFAIDFSGEPRDTRTDTVAATVVDDDGSTAAGSDAATVGITDVPPTITASATPSPAALPAPGGGFLITLTVTNTSLEPVVLAGVADGLAGAGPALGTCAPGVAIGPNGGTLTCSFVATFLADPAATVLDQVVVSAADNDGSTASAVAPVTLSILPAVPPVVTTVPTTIPPTTAPAVATTVPATTTLPPTTAPPTTTSPPLSPPVSAGVTATTAAPAELRLSSPSSPPGGQLTASGSGCAPGETVTVAVAGSAVGSTTATNDGAFSATFDLPNLDVGTTDVVARCGPVVLTTPLEIALQTNVEQGTSTLIVLVFFVLVLLGLSRRGGLVRRPDASAPGPSGRNGA